MQNPINRFIAFLSITVLFTFIGIFVATQQVAYHCEYDSALGQGFQITNNIVLYKPWMFYYLVYTRFRYNSYNYS